MPVKKPVKKVRVKKQDFSAKAIKKAEEKLKDKWYDSIECAVEWLDGVDIDEAPLSAIEAYNPLFSDVYALISAAKDILEATQSLLSGE